MLHGVNMSLFARGVQLVNACRASLLLSIHRSSFWHDCSRVLAKEVGGKFKSEAPGICTKGVEESEKVLGAEDGVGQCECQGRWDDTPAVLYHPRVGSPLHSCRYSRPMHHRLSWVQDFTFGGALSRLVEGARDDGIRDLRSIEARVARGAQGGAEQ